MRENVIKMGSKEEKEEKGQMSREVKKEEGRQKWERKRKKEEGRVE